MNFRTNVYVKLTIILILSLILLIPVGLVRGIIDEREETYAEASNEVSGKWALPQTVTGPVLNIPYEKFDPKSKVTRTGWLKILPETLDIRGELDPQIRTRGIYRIALYRSNLELSGTFSLDKLQGLPVQLSDLDLEQAVIDIGLSDLRGVEEQAHLIWNRERFPFGPGLTQGNGGTGLQAFVPLDSLQGTELAFSSTLRIKGSSMLYFSPVGKTTRVHLSSNWDSPSYNGSFLPDSHRTDASGFKANWSVLHLNRPFPQMWIDDQYTIHASDFGVELFQEVDHYRKSDRVAKYAILFLGFTFLTFFFVEVLRKINIHPIQYLLVGLAITVFYLLLLSISEHLSFNPAYILSAGMTLFLIGSYIRFVLHSIKASLVISGILALLYSFIFVLIGLESYSLIVGSLGVFLILGFVMWSSRKVDWYALKLGQN